MDVQTMQIEIDTDHFVCGGGVFLLYVLTIPFYLSCFVVSFLSVSSSPPPPLPNTHTIIGKSVIVYTLDPLPILENYKK